MKNVARLDGEAASQREVISTDSLSRVERSPDGLFKTSQPRPMQDAPSGLSKRRQGGHSVRVPPLPIPNREVKPHHADGTAKVGE